jgi:hypothetical protein
MRERTKERHEVGDEGVRNVESIVFPDMLSESSVLSVLVMERDPELVRVVHLGDVQRLSTSTKEQVSQVSRFGMEGGTTNLDSLQGSVSNEDLLGERTLDKGMDLLLNSVVLDSLSEVDERRSSSLAKGRLRANKVDEVGNGRESRESRVGDCLIREDESASEQKGKDPDERKRQRTLSAVVGDDLESKSELLSSLLGVRSGASGTTLGDDGGQERREVGVCGSVEGRLLAERSETVEDSEDEV